jgi:hypothetical protein
MKPGPMMLAAWMAVACAVPSLAQVISSSGGAPAPPSQAPISQAAALSFGNAIVSGVVIDGATGAPVEGALVGLTGATGDAVARLPRQLSDAKGRFVFTDVRPSPMLSLTATKFGYFDGGFRSDASADLPVRYVSLADGQWVGNLRILMWRPAAVAGVVIDESGEPVVGVAVRAFAQLRIAGRTQLAGGPIAMTDDRGVYRIGGLSPGRYLIAVPSVQASFLPAAPTTTAAPAPPGAPRPAGEQALDLDPRARLVIGRFATPPPAVTGRVLAYPIAFHGGASVAQAQAVQLQFGEERTGLDVRLEPVPTVTVSGVVDGSPEARRALTLRLLPAGLEELGHGVEAATTMVAADGTFVFLNVPAGTYTIDAPLAVSELTSNMNTGPMQPQLPALPGSTQSYSSQSVPSGPPGTAFMVRGAGTQRTHFGRTTVVVGASDVSGLTVAMLPAGSISGQVVVQADRQDPQAMTPSFVNLSAESATGQSSLGRAANQLRTPPTGGEFHLAPLPPGSYLLRVSLSSGWVVKSIVAGGRDYTTQPIDTSSGQDVGSVMVTVTNSPPTLTGTVRDARGGATDTAAVIVYPADPAQWTNYGFAPTRIRSVVASDAGVFRFSSLPAGDYFLVAVDEARARAWQEPEFFKTMAATAVRVTLSWGETKSQDLRVDR